MSWRAFADAAGYRQHQGQIMQPRHHNTVALPPPELVHMIPRHTRRKRNDAVFGLPHEAASGAFVEGPARRQSGG